MFDAQTEAFYADYLAPSDDFLFGLTTAKIRDDLSWEYARNRAGTTDRFRQWLAGANENGFDAHLALGLVPASVVKTDHTFAQRDMRTDNAISRYFVFDFDVHHETSKKRKDSDYDSGEHLEAELTRALGEGLPSPDYVVRSGSGGVHWWYFVNNYISGVSHKRVYEALASRLNDYGLKLDPQAGSIRKKVRAPGSKNHKPHVMAFARCEKTTARIRSMRALQKDFGINVDVKVSSAKDIEQAYRDDNTFEEYGTYTSEAVRAACPYMVYQMVTGSSELNRTQWLGVASVVRHLEGWPKAWSEACHKHYGDVSDDALANALDPDVGLRGPASCNSIGGGPDLHKACTNCMAHTLPRGGSHPINWIQKVSADLAAGRGITKPPSKKVEKAKPYDQVEMPNYMVEPTNGCYALFSTKTTRGKTGVDKMIAKPAFALTRFEKRSAGSLAFFDVEGTERVVEMQNINSHTSLGKALGKVGVTVFSPQAVIHYIQELITQNEIPTVNMGDFAGWTDDRQAFVTLDRTIRIGGHESVSQLESPPLNGSGMGYAGTVSQWRDSLDVLKRNDAQVLIFSTMLGFASVLPELVNRTHVPPAVVSFYHPESGKGKSTALRLANSAFMQPVETNIGFDDTDASAFKSFGTMRHLFCSIDEMTSKIRDFHFNANRFVNTAMQGFERGRLTSGSAQMERSQWRCIIGISTNASINEALAIDEAQGGLARVHEYYFEKLPMPKFDAEFLLRHLTENHGNAGPEFVRQLMDMTDYRAQVNIVYERWTASLAAAVSADNSHRFALSLFAHTLTALEFTNKFNITRFNSSELFDWCVEQLQMRVKDVNMQVQRTEVSPSDFFNQVRNDIYSAKGFRLYETENGLLRDADYPVFYDKGVLFVTNAAFNAWVTRNKLRRGIIGKWANLGHVSNGVESHSFKMLDQRIAAQKYYRVYLDSFMDKATIDELNQLQESRAHVSG